MADLKIIKLQAENFKRLKAVQIKPDGTMVIISGKNDQGKTSVLDSIMVALAGGRKTPDMPIRKGQKKANVSVDIGEFLVERSFTDKGEYLKVSNKDGFDVKSPQQILNKLVSGLSFDPLEFSQMESPKQSELLKKLTGLDFTILDNERRTKYDDRTIANKEQKSLEAQIQAITIDPNTPEAETSLTDLTQEYQSQMQVIKENDGQREKLKAMKQNKIVLESSVKDYENKIKELQAALDNKKKELEKLNSEGKDFALKVSKLVDPDLAGITLKMEQCEENNKKVRTKKERQELVDRLKAKILETDKLSKRIDEIDAEKEAQLKNADMPIAGLTFDETGISFEDIPFNQISASKKLKVSLAMGMALNPELKVMLIRDGSLLDKDNMKVIEQMAKDKDYQIWIECVGDDENSVGIIIEDGTVREIKEAK